VLAEVVQDGCLRDRSRFSQPPGGRSPAAMRSRISESPVSREIASANARVIFMPLYRAGLWEAVIITPPSKPYLPTAK